MSLEVKYFDMNTVLYHYYKECHLQWFKTIISCGF
jgi:hypothetical protein